MALRIAGRGSAELASVPEPDAAAGEVVVRVLYAAICNTDRKMVARGRPEGRILGHEGAGELEDGTLVGIHPDTGCGACSDCRLGRTNRCPDKQSIGIDRDGCLAEQVAVPTAHAVPLDGVPADLAPLAEPLACCVHAVDRLNRQAPDAAVVVGAGAMGILMTWVLQARGWDVAVVQRSVPRRELAATLGADAVLAPDDDLDAALHRPPEAVVVTAPGATALTWALEHVAEGGSVHAFAGTPDGADIDANLVHYRHLDLVGSTGSGLPDYREALGLIRDGAVPVDRLPTTSTDPNGAVSAVGPSSDPTLLRTIVNFRQGAQS